jgi:predicted PurR-regulated permease PerM
MEPNGPPRLDGPAGDAGPTTRRPIRLGALVGLTLVGIALCVYVAYPFLPALAWALALAVMAFPLHVRISRTIRNPNWAAGLSTACVVLLILIPVMLVAGQLAQEAAAAGTRAEQMAREGRIEHAIDKVPSLRSAVDWARQNYDVAAEVRNLTTQWMGNAPALAQGSLWVLIQILVTVFVLFFALRDWRHLLAAVDDLSPLSRDESDYLFKRVADSIHATVYATVVVSVTQGVMGGLLFWALGLPHALLWGTVMTVLGILPLVGAFLVWGPAAAYLAVEDRWGAALILVAWGVLMAGPVSNWFYAYLAGGRMRLHPVPVLIAFVGGLAVFGVSGMVLGPAILAVTMGLIDVWRQRMGTGPRREGRSGSVEPDELADGGVTEVRWKVGEQQIR